jgi:Uma2 family endonuclease
MQTPVHPVITDPSQLDPEGFYTYADYLLWRFQERVELIRGKLFRMSPAPGRLHQEISTQLTRHLANFFAENPCRVYAAPFDVRLPVNRKSGQDTTVVQPDLCVVCDPSKLDERGCAGAPDLVIEILSPGNSQKEMGEKFQVYEEAGVREYWIVNPGEKVALVYIRNSEGAFVGMAPATPATPIRSGIFPGLVIGWEDILLLT